MKTDERIAVTWSREGNIYFLQEMIIISIKKSGSMMALIYLIIVLILFSFAVALLVFSTNRRPSPEHKVSMLHINVRSLKGHLNELEALVYSLESLPSILFLSEAWLT